MKHYFILSVIFILIGQVSLAQTNKNPKYLIDAKKVFASGNYFEAINQCEKTYKKLGTRGSIKDKGEVAFILAECYRRLEKYVLVLRAKALSLELETIFPSKQKT